jgi:hypothetical protein
MGRMAFIHKIVKVTMAYYEYVYTKLNAMEIVPLEIGTFMSESDFVSLCTVKKIKLLFPKASINSAQCIYMNE